MSFLASFCGILLLGSVVAQPLDITFPGGGAGEDRAFLTLSQFQKILNTDVTKDWGDDQRLFVTKERYWNQTLSDQWSVAVGREQQSQQNRLRVVQGRPQEGLSPFVVCNTEIGKSGQDCKVRIQELLGNHLIPLYNKNDMTCFAVKTLASAIASLPSGFAAAPLAPGMKMKENLIKDIETSVPMVSRIEAVFCAGEAASIVDAETLAAEIFSSMTDVSEGRGQHLRNFGFFETLFNRQTERTNKLEDLQNQLCQEMLSEMSLEVTLWAMSLTLGSAHVEETVYRGCLGCIADALAMRPETCFIEAYQPMQLFNDLASGIVQSGNPEEKPFYDVGLDGEGQIIAISDSGLDIDNCYFWDSQITTPKQNNDQFNKKIRKVIQYVAFVDGSDTLAGHGTHVAGSIAGRRALDGRSESDGEADGIARAAKLAFYDIGDESGSLKTPLPTTLFSPGYKAGARIHSASWGTPNRNFYGGFDRAIDQFAYENPDFLFVVAAGNGGSGHTPNSVGSPAVCKNGISVGATQNAHPHIYPYQNGPDYLVEFSSRGPTQDGRRKPDVVAPGQKILSARAVPGEKGECDGTSKGTIDKSGTSMATPIVSGAAALVRQYFEQGWHSGKPDPEKGVLPKASLVKAVLLNGGEALVGIQNHKTGEINTETTSYDINQGFGRINLLRSLPLKGKNSLSGIFINGKTIGNGGKDAYEVTIRDNSQEGCESLSATLVWTDPPGAPNCNEGCVLNDLDLYMTHKGQNGRFFPNGLDEADSSNNAERVRIDKPDVGQTYTVHVVGKDMLGPQEYSLAVTGCFESGGGNPPQAPPGGSDEGPEEGDCPDGKGLITVKEGMMRSCSWLITNFDNYGYLCNFRDVALECPSTCDSCFLLNSVPGDATTKRAAGLMNGRNRWYGNTFQVEAKTALTVTTFDVHMVKAGSYRVQVRTRPGQVRSVTVEEWKVLCDATVTSSGYGAFATIPEADCAPLKMASKSFHTFYVTLVEEKNLVMTNAEGQNDRALIDNSDLKVTSGFAVTYLDSGSFDGYSFNGAVHYTLPSQCRDQSGTVHLDDIVGERTCFWLANNFDRFAYTCAFAGPAVHCPVTCNICEEF